jgi:hypothetical protein
LTSRLPGVPVPACPSRLAEKKSSPKGPLHC